MSNLLARFRSRLRGWRRAGALILAAAGVVGATVAFAAPPAHAATTYKEFPYRSNDFGLVLTARAASSGAHVFLATDNNSHLAQWSQQLVSDGVPFGVTNGFRYKLRATGFAGQALCLDVAGKSINFGVPIIVAPCDGSLSQVWYHPTLLGTGPGGSLPFRNLNSSITCCSRGFMGQPPGPVFNTDLQQLSGLYFWAKRTSAVV
jgi:hypothetical protein